MTPRPRGRRSGVLRGAYAPPRGRVRAASSSATAAARAARTAQPPAPGIGITHELTTVSSLAFDASYVTQVDEDDPDEPNIHRTDFTASYIHALTASVSAEIGYGFRHRVEDPDDATSNRVFLVIGKTFETGL